MKCDYQLMAFPRKKSRGARMLLKGRDAFRCARIMQIEFTRGLGLASQARFTFLNRHMSTRVLFNLNGLAGLSPLPSQAPSLSGDTGLFAREGPCREGSK